MTTNFDDLLKGIYSPNLEDFTSMIDEDWEEARKRLGSNIMTLLDNNPETEGMCKAIFMMGYSEGGKRGARMTTFTVSKGLQSLVDALNATTE